MTEPMQTQYRLRPDAFERVGAILAAHRAEQTAARERAATLLRWPQLASQIAAPARYKLKPGAPDAFKAEADAKRHRPRA